jgi:dolichyl-phosphate-mannose-protein mannosyltransferase
MRTAARWGTLLVLAVLFTLLNAFKPLHVDDTAYYYYARQAAADPLDPYGFEIFWYDHPQPANEVLAPPVLPYWWSLALRFTQQPVLWKLWLFPFSLCLVWSLHFLFRRFCHRLALLLTWLTVLSPALLPGFNLMLDVPALALGLGALALFIRGVDHGEVPRILLAGIIAGLAMQTKYTALLAPVAMFLYALTHRWLRLWLLALLPSLAVFTAWEVFVARRYGQSHFLYHLTHGHDSLLQRGYLIPLLFSLTGTVASALLLLGLCALRVRTAFAVAAAGLVVLSFAAVALIDLRFHGEVSPSTALFGTAATARWDFTLAEVLFGLCGLVLMTIVSVVAWRLWRGQPDDWFLLLWLGLEVAGFFGLSPFPAERRVLGLVVVLTLLTGRLAARTCRQRRRLLGLVLACGILLGVIFQGVDARDAAVQQEAVARAAAHIAEDGGEGTVWFTGHWGFQFYAERAGMHPLSSALLKRGDWLIVPDRHIDQQRVGLEDAPLAEVHRLVFDDRIPLRTLPFYYVGHVGIEHRRGPRLVVRVYRVRQAFVPAP